MNRGDKIPLCSHILALCCAGIVTALLIALPTDSSDGDDDKQATAPSASRQIPLPLPETPDTRLSNSDNPGSSPDVQDWRTAIVTPGDSLSRIFSRLGLKSEDLYGLLSSVDQAQSLEQLQPGENLRVRTEIDGSLSELIYESNGTQGIRVVRDGDSYRVHEVSLKVERRTSFSAGVIANSLYQSALKAGLSDRLIMQLADIFGWDIDFALDIRPGDSFTVIYEEDYVSGERLGNGEILAAEFVNQDKTYRSVRHTDAEGNNHFYTPEGRSLRQAFLRTPVDFRRISSHFQPQRWHPVLGVRRPHKGVDYAAAIGTPIKASGDGRVAFIGKKGGYGLTVILQHGQRYTTLYAHMSRFRQGLRTGDQVNQGDIIGYVGMTGLATGPHLHYEFRVDGEHKDPVTVKLPGPPPIEPRYLADFRRKASALAAQLELFRRTLLAMNTNR